MSPSTKTIGILVARMTSSRLPGKSLRVVGGKPLLNHCLDRLRATEGLDEIWLATTQHPVDEQLLLWGIQNEIQVFGYPGEIDDVVGRISATLNKAEATRFVMVLGDTPFADPRLMTRLLQELDAHPEWESVTLDHSNGPSIHSGIACYTASGWKKIDAASKDPQSREHAGSILKEQSGLIVQGVIKDDPLYYEGPFRLTVDTQADLEFINTVFTALQRPDHLITTAEIINYLKAHPELTDLNVHVHQKSVSETPLKVLMAVQTGGNFGTGHLSRCQTLARVLEEHFAAGVTFWLDSPNAKHRRDLADEGYNVVEGNWSLPETLRQGNYDRVIIDFQTPVTPSLIQGIRATHFDLPIIVLDNNGLGCADADVVIFPNAHSQANPEWATPDKTILQGPEYTVLGSGFLYDKNPALESEALSMPCVLITMGGTDPELLTEKVLDALKDLKDCHIDLVVPPMYPQPDNLDKIATVLPSTITLHWRVQHLKPLMQRATVAVAAFGITVYELAYMGVPTLILGHYENQQDDMKRFAQHCSAINLGWGRHMDPHRLFALVRQLIADANEREQMARHGKALVDPKGPLRVAEAIVAASPRSLSLVQD